MPTRELLHVASGASPPSLGALRRIVERVFSRRCSDAASVRGPTRVALDCRVAEVGAQTSPLSGTRAALIRWTVLEHFGAPANRGLTVLARGCFSERLLLEFNGLHIEVPLAAARLALREDVEDAVMLERIPTALKPVIARFPYRAHAYREALLLSGDRVRLVATLERVSPDYGYRTQAGPRVDLRAMPELERVKLTEQ